MNKAILMGRLTRDPETRYAQTDNSLAITRFTLAVDRRFKRDGEQDADFISCTSFGKTAEFVEKYFRQGMKMALVGRIQTGSYTNKEGQKVYTTEVIVEEVEFVESKANSDAAVSASRGNSQGNSPGQMNADQSDGFLSIDDGIDEELPFN